MTKSSNGLGLLEEDESSLSVLDYMPMYGVILHNDDETPMDFVVKILIEIFDLTLKDAIRVMEEAHTQQIALVGIYTFEQAEFKIEKSVRVARENSFPLEFSMEKR